MVSSFPPFVRPDEGHFFSGLSRRLCATVIRTQPLRHFVDVKVKRKMRERERERNSGRLRNHNFSASKCWYPWKLTRWEPLTAFSNFLFSNLDSFVKRHHSLFKMWMPKSTRCKSEYSIIVICTINKRSRYFSICPLLNKKFIYWITNFMPAVHSHRENPRQRENENVGGNTRLGRSRVSSNLRQRENENVDGNTHLGRSRVSSRALISPR